MMVVRKKNIMKNKIDFYFVKGNLMNVKNVSYIWTKKFGE
jgi:hypothetical protein